MRVAIVHDWLYVRGGAERVLRELLRLYSDADVFTLFDVLTDEDRAWIGFKCSTTSFLQRMPGIAKLHRSLLPMMPFAIEQFDFSGYDLVISSSNAVAKGVITGPDQVHIAYVHTPMRYAWDLQHQYLSESDGGLGVKRNLARILLHRIRVWDTCSSQRPDAIASNSAFVARRIKKAFGREARVIHPPVDVTPRGCGSGRRRHFLAAGRLVSYKNTRVIVEAFKLLPEYELVVTGTGPEEKRLRSIAGPNVSFTGFVSDEDMRHLMSSAHALIFAALEDFGIVPVELQAEGTPVLALGHGGARETVVTDGTQPTGMFFEKADPHSIAACVNTFMAHRSAFSADACQKHSQRFAEVCFRRKFASFATEELARKRKSINGSNAGEQVSYNFAAE